MATTGKYPATGAFTRLVPARRVEEKEAETSDKERKPSR